MTCGTAISDCESCSQNGATITCNSCGNGKELSGDNLSCNNPTSASTIIIVSSVVGGVVLLGAGNCDNIQGLRYSSVCKRREVVHWRKRITKRFDSYSLLTLIDNHFLFFILFNTFFNNYFKSNILKFSFYYLIIKRYNVSKSSFVLFIHINITKWF